jgi:cytochrome P450
MCPSEKQKVIAVWQSDELGSQFLPEIKPPYFHEELGAWVLSRHADVLEAMRSSSLTMSGAELATDESAAAMSVMRKQTADALSPAQLRSWSMELIPLMEQHVARLPNGSAVDLIDDYLVPCCLALAALVTEVDAGDAGRLREMARPVSESAAEPSDLNLKLRAEKVTSQLQPCFHSKTETLRDSGFVALSHTLPALLANGIYSLLQYPEQWALLNREPQRVEQALEELMRYGGLSRSIKRRAKEEVVIAGVPLRQGDRLILRIIAANYDPERFTEPNELDILRRDAGHLTLGAGPHACVGASLLRIASAVILRPLLQTFSGAKLTDEVAWQGGSGFRAPRHLQVILERTAE